MKDKKLSTFIRDKFSNLKKYFPFYVNNVYISSMSRHLCAYLNSFTWQSMYLTEEDRRS